MPPRIALRPDRRGRLFGRQRRQAAPRARRERTLRSFTPAEGRHCRRGDFIAAAAQHCLARVPDVQPGTGDAAEGRHAARAVARPPEAPRPVADLSRGARRRARESALRHGVVRRVCGARRAVSQRVCRVAAGGRAQRQPRHGAAALRRLRARHRDGEAQDRVGARVSHDSDRARPRHGRAHRAEGRARVLRLLRVVRRQSSARHTHHRRRLRRHPLAAAADRDCAGRRHRGRRRVDQAARPAGALRSHDSRGAGRRQHRREVCDVADGADNRDAPRRRPAPRQRARDRREVHR